MKLHSHRSVFFLSSLLFAATLQACNHHGKRYIKIQPARVETRFGEKIPYVVLTPEAEIRLGIVVVKMEKCQSIHGKSTCSLPVSSILYDETGRNWVYLRKGNQTYHRVEVELLKVDGKSAFVSSQSSGDALVVSVGAAELLGTESGVGK
jgi:hypothetical protein